eukprot:scpid90947/ scgid11243/ 
MQRLMSSVCTVRMFMDVRELKTNPVTNRQQVKLQVTTPMIKCIFECFIPRSAPDDTMTMYRPTQNACSQHKAYTSQSSQAAHVWWIRPWTYQFSPIPAFMNARREFHYNGSTHMLCSYTPC